jgi:hypothetical protein
MGCLIANRSGARPTKGPTTKIQSLLLVVFFDYTETLTMIAHLTHINARTQTLIEIDGVTKIHRCRRERRLPLKAPTLLNSRKFAPTGSRTQNLRCY